MKPLFRPLIRLLLLAGVAHADLDPASWHSATLATAAAGTNEWYLFPDAAKSPRVLAKTTGTGVNVTRRLLDGGPPAWTAGAATTTANLNQQGVLVPRSDGGAYLVAPHGGDLRLISFNAAGAQQVNELIDSDGTIGSSGLSAALDSGSNLHIAYVGNAGASETLRYACRTTSGTWSRAVQDLTESTNWTIRQTAVVPSSSKIANIYFTLYSGTTTSLVRVNVFDVAGNLFLVNPVNFENQVADPLAGSRTAGTDRVFYFKSTGNGHWMLKRLVSENLGEADLEDLLDDPVLATPKNVVLATGPDGRQRIAWYDSAGRKIHYLRPTVGDGPPYAAGQPVSPSTTTAELRALHFGADGTPYLLYRRSGTQAAIAFPNDGFDFNGNGRPDLIDKAFNSTTAGLEVLPIGAPVAGFPMAEGKFKFRFPTVGSAIANSAGGVTSPGRGIDYGVEMSTDAITWTLLDEDDPIFFVAGASTGTFPDQLKSFTAIYNEVLPGASPKRFFRMRITRNGSAF